MSQPRTTSQNPKPLSTAEYNLSLCRYLPRSTPSMSDTATLTRCPGDSRMASSTFLTVMACGMESPGYRCAVVAGGEARFYRGHARGAHDARRAARAWHRKCGDNDA